MGLAHRDLSNYLNQIFTKGPGNIRITNLIPYPLDNNPTSTSPLVNYVGDYLEAILDEIKADRYTHE